MERSGNQDQAKRSLRRPDPASPGQLYSSEEAIRFLLVLTPDQAEPPALQSVKDPEDRLLWASFVTLEQAINELLSDNAEAVDSAGVISEREAFLLRELQMMLVEEGLVESQSEVLVVAARHAWPEYQWCSAYICQQGRSFRPVKRIGFYSLGQIHELAPMISKTHDDVVWSGNST
jgi:hypothetical protein